MNRLLERYFRLSENQTTARTEALAGVTTFLTMAYIIFVQPAVLSGTMFGQKTGMDFGAVTTATCLSAAVASAVMALYARYPIAQAPGMGENFFFVFSALPAAAAAGFADGWQVALGAVFISGLLFLLLSCFGVREAVMDAVSPSLRNGIAAGIGLFIAFIGLQNTGLVLKDPGTAVRLNPHLFSPDLVVFFVGFAVTAGLHARRVRYWGGHGVGGAAAMDRAAPAGESRRPAGHRPVAADDPVQMGACLGIQASVARADVFPTRPAACALTGNAPLRDRVSVHGVV
jgi:adenine/guanine/hypoxanthine permease